MLFRSFRKQQYAALFLCCVLLLFPSACTTKPATPFIAPRSTRLPAIATIAIVNSTKTASPTINSATTQTTAVTCNDSMNFVQDGNFPDGTSVTAGQVIVKEWVVENDGSCNWDERYHLRLMDGYPALGAASEIALSKVDSGKQTTISVSFSAPLETGTFKTAWQAYNPENVAFGNPVFMIIVVNP